MKRFVSLYSGAGGLDLGFIAAGFVPVFANDISARCHEDLLRCDGRDLEEDRQNVES